MDPKGFSDFIARHGKIVGVETVKANSNDLTAAPSYIYKFEDGATAKYTPATVNEQGEQVTPPQFLPDESVPVAAERKTSTAAAQESISAPATSPYVARTGPIDAAHPEGIYWTPNKNYTEGKKKPLGEPYRNSTGQWIQRFDDGTYQPLPPDAAPEGQAKPPLEQPDPANPGKTRVWDPTANDGQGGWKPGTTIAPAPVVGKRVDVNTETKRTTVTDTNGNTLEDRPATASELQTQGSGGTFQHVTRNGKTYVVSLGPNGEELGVQPSNIPAEEPKPQTSIIDPSKQQAVAIVNPTTGDVASKPIPGTGAKPPPAGFDETIKAAFGSIVDDLQQKTIQLRELEKTDPNWTSNDTLKELERLREVAQAKLNEQVGILNAQQNIRGQDIQQNATAVNAATSRLPFATNTANQAIDLIKMMGVGAGKLPPGSLDTFFKGYLDQQKGFANSIQALPDLSTTQVPRTPQQAELMGGQNPPISFNINIGGAGGGVSMPGINPVSSAPTLGADLGAGAIAQPNIPSPSDIPGASGTTPGLMPNPTTMDEFFQQEASKPNQSPARMQALERIKAELGVSRQAPGMRWSGGQLRAPGYSAGV